MHEKKVRIVELVGYEYGSLMVEINRSNVV